MGLQVDPKELKKRQFFLEGNIPKAVLSVCLPMALFQLINELFRVFDLVITSQINPESVSAVSFFNQLNNSIVSVGTGLSIGAGILIAGLYGAGEYERLKTTVNTTFFMAGAAALVLVAGLILGARPILRLANTPAQLVEIGLNYYRITALNLFFTFFNNVYIAIEKARGNGSKIMRINFAMALTKFSFILDKVLEAADTVEITEYLNRLPKQLSGGQKQRVALARAIVRKPKAFLMDEPLSNLDAKLRNSTRIEIVRLQQRLGVTTIYVTHDQTEAMTMADRIVVMKEGVIQQVGTPQEIYAAPVNLFVASFIGTPQMNFIPGKLSETGFENESFRLSLPDALKAKLRSSIGKEVILGLRPEALAVSEGIQENTIPVRLEEVEYMGRYQIVHAMVGGSSLVLSVPSDVKINPEFYVSLSMDKAHFFDGETTRSLLCREVEENHA